MLCRISSDSNRQHLVNYCCPISAKIGGSGRLWFSSAYHLFVYNSLLLPANRDVVLRMADPGKVWWALNKATFPKIANWEKHRIQLMTKCIELKYVQNPLLYAHLCKFDSWKYDNPDHQNWYDFDGTFATLCNNPLIDFSEYKKYV